MKIPWISQWRRRVQAGERQREYHELQRKLDPDYCSRCGMKKEPVFAGDRVGSWVCPDISCYTQKAKDIQKVEAARKAFTLKEADDVHYMHDNSDA